MVVTEVDLPGMNGFKFAQILSQEFGLDIIPVFFVTIQHETPDVVQGLELGVDYLIKPFAVPEFLVV